MGNSQPIGIFDSGVGGISILKEIKKILPLENAIFLADQANVPYGSKSKSQLEAICGRITQFLLRYKIKLLVIACNTATCYALDHLRSKYTIPIIGVVPAIKPASDISKKSRIAVMSTPATAKSKYLKSLIEDYASGADVLKLGCAGLEDSIEELNYGNINTILPSYVSPIKSFGADVIVLGCTHYPLIKDIISKSFGSSVSIIDSGEAVAQRVKFVLGQNNMLSAEKRFDAFYTTGNPETFSKVASTLLKHKVTAKKAVI